MVAKKQIKPKKKIFQELEYCCGHWVITEIIYPDLQDNKSAKEYFKYRLCPTCYAKEKEKFKVPFQSVSAETLKLYNI